MTTTKLDNRHLREILPHRFPFLLVDKVIQIETRKYVVGIKNVSANEPFFQGHFEDNPIMPGVLIIESLAQTGAALFLNDPEYFGRYAFFASMSDIEFKHQVLPGDQLRLEMEVLNIDEHLIKMKGQALVDGKCVCFGTFTFNLAQRPTKPQIHPTASVHHTAVLGKNVVIGPNTIVGEDVHIGDNSSIEANCFIERWTRIGEDCKLSFGTVIGSQAQDTKYKGEKSWVVLGDRNELREYVTIHRGTGENSVTKIGSDNMLMTHVHLAHNCELGNNIIIANSTNLGGFSKIDDYVVIGGVSGIHQMTRVGKGCMIGAYTRLVQDVTPYMMCEGNPAIIRGLNLVGLKRRGASSDTIKEVRDMFNTLFRGTLNSVETIEALKSKTLESNEAKEILNFVTAESHRGLVKRQAKAQDK